MRDERRYHEGKGKVGKMLRLEGKLEGQNVCIQKDPCHHNKFGKWVRQKGCVGEGDFRPIQGSRDEIASSTKTKAYCVISPFYSSQFGLNQSHGEWLCKI